MKFDFKNILIGIVIGILGTITVGCLINGVDINIQVGNNTEEVK